MSISVGVLAAKNRVSELRNQVEAGEGVVIPRRGVPVAMLTGIAHRDSRMRAALDGLLEIRRRSLPGPESMRELIDEGRRR